ncbi:hypothetical protein [Flavobacterium sp. CS20]|uniref:hypothetical protein n=1 Tax=Flavobacterium sp. CS20 TaxID=2775246 RepID=UPI001B3A5831|nr:hypothetical protein [Flavobacterium sp. CS20]QTY28202.1 hypothetical protein IGB25_06940 [Flavobacterium sp. CS20]
MKIPIQNTIKKALIHIFSIVLIISCVENKKIDKSALAVAVGLVGSSQGEVWIKKQDSTLHTIVVPKTANGIFETAELSPNKKFVLLTAPLGDFGEAWVYNVKDGKLYEIEGGFGLGEMGWLKDNRIMLHQGCVLATHCKKLESINNKTPWLVEVTEDLSKKN